MHAADWGSDAASWGSDGRCLEMVPQWKGGRNEKGGQWKSPETDKSGKWPGVSVLRTKHRKKARKKPFGEGRNCLIIIELLLKRFIL